MQNKNILDEINFERKKIDLVDKKILKLLKQRIDIVQKIGMIKFKNNINANQPSRLRELLFHRKMWAIKLGLNKKFISELYLKIHSESIRNQEIISKSNGKK